MIESALGLVTGMIGLAMLLNVFRLLRGPQASDRILALDTLYINTIALLMLFGIQLGSMMFYEAAVIIALLGFVGTLVLAKFIMRRDIIE
jgi:multicomponent K+:H+ antiporter subunit F